ncbi:MAG: trypsin-like peptidase domain-containing protein [Rhodopirellula sp.]|nr:trypsin-like peptidase domain-containing protein [Rhodopirellula sp.]
MAFTRTAFLHLPVRGCRCLCFIVVALAIVVLSSRDVNAQSSADIFAAIEKSIEDVVEKAEHSIVAIARIPIAPEPLDRQPARAPFGLQPDLQLNDPLAPGYVPKNPGTGILMASPDNPRLRLILTNYHVVRGGQPFRNDGIIRSESRIAVRFSRTQAAWATIYAADPRSDLAVLAFDPSDIESAPADIPVIHFPDDSTIRKGQFVISLGNPYAIARDGSPSVSLGMISNMSRFPFMETTSERETIHQFGTLLHVDTRLGPGTSGGALLNRDGHLIGITTSLAALEGYETSVGYAIPLNSSMRRIVEDLLRGYEIEYGFLGIVPGVPREARATFGSVTRETRGVAIRQVVPDSPAFRKGLRPNDIVLAVNGVPMFEPTDILREVGLLAPGSTARLRIIRASNGSEKIVPVPLAKWPRRHVDQIIVSNDRYPLWRGLKVDWPTSRTRHFDFDRPYPRAVVVDRVEPGSPTEIAGLREGDLLTEVHGVEVESPVEFLKAVANSNGPIQVRLLEGSREPLIRTIGPNR